MDTVKAAESRVLAVDAAENSFFNTGATKLRQQGSQKQLLV